MYQERAKFFSKCNIVWSPPKPAADLYRVLPISRSPAGSPCNSFFAATGRFPDSHRSCHSWKTHHDHAGLCSVISLL